MEIIRHSNGNRRKQNMPSLSDRLSGLPDSVICHILSSLPTKHSVATSTLARRWRFLWILVPNLDFEKEHFKGETQHSDIMHRVMLVHEAKNINTLRLSRANCSEYQLETWITTAIRHNLQNLDLDIESPVIFMLPRRLFTCKTLVGLKLSCCKLGTPATNGDVVYNLPSLKKLHLYCVEYEDDEALPHLLSGCPLLEDLIIYYTFEEGRKNLSCVNISSPTIRKLEVNFGYMCYDDIPDYRLIINTPALRYLKMAIASLEGLKFFATIFTSLNEAGICIKEDFMSTYGNNYSCYLVNLLNSLCNVKCLKISNHHFATGINVEVGCVIVRLDNLSMLDVLMAFDWHLLIKFLEIADNLEVITVDVEEIYWGEPEQVPTCLLSRLRIIRIDRMVCTEDGFNMVRYFLRNAQVLERMEIYSKHDEVDFKGKFDALQKISLFEPGSKACQLAFY